MVIYIIKVFGLYQARMDADKFWVVMDLWDPWPIDWFLSRLLGFGTNQHLKNTKKYFVNQLQYHKKFPDFSITPILREIIFVDSRSAKFAFLTHLEALNFDFYEFLHFWRLKFTNKVANLLGFSFIVINNKIRPIYCNKSNKIQ